jgi:hypothetical protein
MTLPATPILLLVGDDEALIYLIERYAARAGLGVRVAAPSPEMVPDVGPAAVWFMSLESLEAARPRETGLVGHDAPLVVCSPMADEARARRAGADFCVVHPLTFLDFMAAMTTLDIVADRTAATG